MEKKQLKYPTDEINRRLDLAQSAEQKANELSRLVSQIDTDKVQQAINKADAIQTALDTIAADEDKSATDVRQDAMIGELSSILKTETTNVIKEGEGARVSSALLVDCEFVKGRKYRLTYIVPNLNQSVTFVTFDGTSNVDYFINTAKNEKNTDVIEIVATANASQLKIYVLQSYQYKIEEVTEQPIPLNNITERLDEIYRESNGTDSVDLSKNITYQQGYIKTDGSVSPDAVNVNVTSYINVANYDRVTISVLRNPTTKSGIAFYDSSFKFIKLIAYNDGERGNVARQYEKADLVGVTYIRSCVYTDVDTDYTFEGVLPSKTGIIVDLQKQLQGISNNIEIDYLANAETISQKNIDVYMKGEKLKMVFLDNNYKYFSVANIKTIIDTMSESGLNYLQLGFGGSGYGNMFKLNDMSINANGIKYDISGSVVTADGKWLSEEEMLDIIDYASSKGIGIIPAMSCISHMTALLNTQPSYRYLDSINALDINNPEAVNWAVAILEKYAGWFSSKGCKYFNVCADEFYNINNGYSHLYENDEYKYADVINRLTYAVSRYAMIPMLWNDALCVNNSKFPIINRESIVLYWGQNSKPAYAEVQTLADNGYDRIVNSSERFYYVAGNGNKTNATLIRNNFDINKFARYNATYNGIPIGAMFCIWVGQRELLDFGSPVMDDGNAITQDVLPIIRAFGEVVNSQLVD